MGDTMAPPTANLAAQSLYAKLQKLSQDIQLQHSILSAQKETILKSRQKAYDVPKTEPADPTHLVHTHAGTVLQHRAMIIKHYELIRQHKQMVKEQGLHVQNLTSTLLNIQQETTVVDELMNTKMAENRNAIQATPTPTPIPAPTATPTISLPYSNYGDQGPSFRNGKLKRIKSQSSSLILDSAVNTENDLMISPDITSIPRDISITSHIANTKLDDPSETENTDNEQITITTTTSTTTTTPTITTTEITTISSISTPTATTTTTTTTTTTKASPSITPLLDETPLPLSP